jgi:hypothetical protein
MSIKTKAINKYGYNSHSIIADKEEEDGNSVFYDHVRNEKLATLHNTGNGFIAKFYAFSSMEQPFYVCLDYAQADYLRRLLNEADKEQQHGC